MPRFRISMLMPIGIRQNDADPGSDPIRFWIHNTAIDITEQLLFSKTFLVFVIVRFNFKLLLYHRTKWKHQYFSFIEKLSRHLSNSSISSVSTNSSALPYSTPLSPEAYLASLPSSVPAPRPEDEMETYSIASINSEMSTNTLRDSNAPNAELF